MKLYRSIKNGPTRSDIEAMGNRPLVVELVKNAKEATGSIVTLELMEFTTVNFVEFKLYGKFGTVGNITFYGGYSAEKKRGWICFSSPNFYQKRRRLRLRRTEKEMKRKGYVCLRQQGLWLEP